MEICLITKMFPPSVGGAETYAEELANALGERGHNVDVYTQSISGDDNYKIHSNVTVNRLTKSREYLAFLGTVYFSARSRSKIDFSEYDIIHGMLMPASTIALTPGLGMADIPIVVTSHGTALDEAFANEPANAVDYLLKYVIHPTDAILDSVAGRIADKIISISQHTHDQLIDLYRFNEKKIQFIPHGVDIDKFHPEQPKHPAVSDDQYTVVYVGRLGPRKGLGLAIKSLAQMESNAELLIAGKGRHKQRIKSLASKLGVSDKVNILGYVPDSELPSLYASSDTLILPSTYEGFGLVLLEAMACATPVVGTNAGGIPTVIQDGTTGYVISQEPAELATKLDTLGGSKQKRDEMGREARNQAKSMSWSIVAEEVEKLYSDVLNKEDQEWD